MESTCPGSRTQKNNRHSQSAGQYCGVIDVAQRLYLKRDGFSPVSFFIYYFIDSYRLKNGRGTIRALRARFRIAMASSIPISEWLGGT